MFFYQFIGAFNRYMYLNNNNNNNNNNITFILRALHVKYFHGRITGIIQLKHI